MKNCEDLYALNLSFSFICNATRLRKAHLHVSDFLVVRNPTDEQCIVGQLKVPVVVVDYNRQLLTINEKIFDRQDPGLILDIAGVVIKNG